MKKTKEQISYNMQKVRSKDSEIELLLRKALWTRGLRYRKNVKDIFGRPDIAFIGKKVAIFVDSEFWHGFDWDNRRQDFKSHQEFWISKIERNIARDIEVTNQLQSDGWKVLRFWGKTIKKNVESCVSFVIQSLEGR